VFVICFMIVTVAVSSVVATAIVVVAVGVVGVIGVGGGIQTSVSAIIHARGSHGN
jgi:hypothetical protein